MFSRKGALKHKNLSKEETEEDENEQKVPLLMKDVQGYPSFSRLVDFEAHLDSN